MLGQLRSLDQWWLFLRVFAFAVTVPLLFRLRIAALNRHLERRIRSARQSGNASATSNQIVRCVEIVQALGNPLVRPSCLVRAVTLYYFLRRAGMDLTLCFGAACKEGQLVEAVGHCWLSRNGEPYLEARDPRASFVPIYWLPSSWRGVEACKSQTDRR